MMPDKFKECFHTTCFILTATSDDALYMEVKSDKTGTQKIMALSTKRE
jgi:hypothetical protein